MKIGILSDIHSNCFALEAVLEDVQSADPDLIVVLGDFFGYYPWAEETFALVRQVEAVAVKGNHDMLLVETWEAASCFSRMTALAPRSRAAMAVTAPASP